MKRKEKVQTDRIAGRMSRVFVTCLYNAIFNNNPANSYSGVTEQCSPSRSVVGWLLTILTLRLNLLSL